MRPRLTPLALVAGATFGLVGQGLNARAQGIPSSSPSAASSTPPVASGDPTADRRKKDFVERARIQIRSVVTANHREVTDEERALIRDHWVRAMRLLRIRDVAEAEHDPESAARAEKALERFGKRFYEELRGMNARAPAKSAAVGSVPRPVSVAKGPGAE